MIRMDENEKNKEISKKTNKDNSNSSSMKDLFMDYPIGSSVVRHDGINTVQSEVLGYKQVNGKSSLFLKEESWYDL